MIIKKILLLTLFLFFISLFIPRSSQAIDLQEALTSENSALTRIREGIEYFFAFSVEKKIQVLDKHADKRLIMASEYANEGNNERVQNLVQNYGQIKERQNNLLGKVNNGKVLGTVEERTIEQQKTMEEIKTKSSGDLKRVIVQTQEQVVNQVAERVVVTNGTEGQTEFFNKVEHVWAPGTGPGGGEAGVVIEGGQMQFAPGTSAGGQSGSDIKTIEVVTGGGENNVVDKGDNGGGLAPGTTQGGNTGNTIDQGTVDPGNSPGDSDWVIDP